MSIKKWFLFVFIKISFISSYSQQISGVVLDNFGKAIPKATILIKKTKGTYAISEFFLTNEEGAFTCILKKEYKNIIYIEANALNYKKTVDSIVTPIADKKFLFNFMLTPKVTELDEVIIAERKKFEIKKDTVVFNPEAYKDGTERKVEDLLKKLPGVEVTGDGRIKYRGKDVEAVQLDGDDLFGANYTMGTKNITVDIVEQIEAIEHYSKNPLLKGIENSDNVALNLKLKKGKVDYSGTADAGYGYGNKPYYDMSSTILGVAKKIKSFGVFSFNTIGLNKTPFDYFSGALSVEDIANSNLYSTKIINPSPINSILGSARIRINKEWSGNYNVIYRLSPRLKMKSNIYYIKDEFLRQELYQNQYNTGEELIRYSDRTSIIKTPQNKRLDLKLTYNVSEKSLVEFDTSVGEEVITSQNHLTKNLETTATTQLKTNDFFWKNILQVTNKLGTSQALQFKSVYARNNVPQKFNTFGNFLSEEGSTNLYSQFSENRKESLQNHLILLGKKNKIKYALTLGMEHNDTPFQSSLLENEINLPEFQNDFTYKKTNYYTLYSLAYKNKVWELEPSLTLNYIYQHIEDHLNTIQNTDKHIYNIEPSLNTVYHINTISKLRFFGEYKQNTPKENFLFTNSIVTNNRSLRKNVTSLNVEKLQKYTISYRINDLQKNIETNLAINHTNRKNIYLSNIEVNPNYTSITYFQSPVTVIDWHMTASIARYIRFLKTTVKHTSQYSISNFKNIVNQSELRDAQSRNYSGGLFAKTAFRIPVNFENNITYNVSSYFITTEQLKNTNSSITNTFKTIIKPNKNWMFTLFYYYFRPNLKNNQDFSFLDFSIQYRPKKIKWISGRLLGKNLLDNRVFQQVENSDYFTTVFQSNLIPRYFMFSLDINF